MSFLVLLFLSRLGQMGATEISDIQSKSTPVSSSVSSTISSIPFDGVSTQSHWLNTSTSTSFTSTTTQSSTVTSTSSSQPTYTITTGPTYPSYDPVGTGGLPSDSTSSNSTATSQNCISSDPTIFYLHTTITVPGTTIYVSGNATNVTSTASLTEITGPSWCATPDSGSVSILKSSPPGVLSTTLAPVPFASNTVVITSTLKTPVITQSPASPPVQFPNPPASSPGPSPTPAPPNPPQNGQNTAPGIGVLVSSALATAQPPNPGSGFGGGSNPSSSSGDGGGIPGLGVIIGSMFGSSGASSGSGSPGFSGGSGGSNPGLSLGSGVVVNGVPVNQGPSNGIVIGSSTFQEAPAPQTVNINGETFTVLPSNAGVVAPGGLTIPPAPGITAGPSLTLGSGTFSVNPTNPSQVIMDGSTIQIPAAGSTVFAISGTTYTVEPTAIISGSSTIPLPPAAGPAATFSAETVDGLTFDLGSTLAVISGTTAAIGFGAPSSTLTVGTETITAGPEGLIFPDTTVAPLPSTEVVDGITFGLQPTDVVISGTTYDFDRPTTLVLGTETVIIGTDGVVLPHTTLDLITSSTLPTLTQVAPKETAATSPKASPTNGADGGPKPRGSIKIYWFLLATFVAVLGLP